MTSTRALVSRETQSFTPAGPPCTAALHPCCDSVRARRPDGSRVVDTTTVGETTAWFSWKAHDASPFTLAGRSRTDAAGQRAALMSSRDPSGTHSAGSACEHLGDVDPCRRSPRSRPRDTGPRRRPGRLPACVSGAGQPRTAPRRDPVHQRSPCGRTVFSPPHDPPPSSDRVTRERRTARAPREPRPDPSDTSLPVDGRTGRTLPPARHPVSPARPPRAHRTSTHPEGTWSSDAPVVMRDDHRTRAAAVSRETTAASYPAPLVAHRLDGRFGRFGRGGVELRPTASNPKPGIRCVLRTSAPLSRRRSRLADRSRFHVKQRPAHLDVPRPVARRRRTTAPLPKPASHLGRPPRPRRVAPHRAPVRDRRRSTAGDSSSPPRPHDPARPHKRR